jgi:acetyl esterase/lipase
MTAKLTSLVLLAALAAAAAEFREEIKLWANGAPGAVAGAKEVFEPGADARLPKRFTVTHDPSIYVFLPPPDHANGMAMVIAPGGGHTQLVIDKEGYEIADWCNQHGIAAFVLKYRLAKAPGVPYSVEKDTLADAERAMRVVRARATEWRVDPKRIGFIGFSAGGYVAALIETRFDKGNDSSSDPIERASSRPDFAVVVYPGYAPGSITVPKDAPPTFLACADDDRSHVVTTVNLYLDLEKQSIPSEMHIYASGGHGFGIRQNAHPVSTWQDRLLDWMKDRKL